MKNVLLIALVLFFSCEDKPLPLDCEGIEGGSATMQTYCLDSDYDGLGGDYCSYICNASVEEGWVDNSSDNDDNCTSNFHDCAGVCDGHDFSCIEE